MSNNLKKDITMKKFLLAAAIIVSLFGISYGIAASVNGKAVTVKADCENSSC